ncbi:MAG: tetratricopeptide repeat protein [Pseudomonadota bacterium]|nr:tetratricopeptide repeat protein [Pseudomonadota bacterium]
MPAHYPEARQQAQLAFELHKDGRIPDALNAFDRALQIEPDYAEAHLGRGNIFLFQGRADAALAAYDLALSYRGNFAEAYNNRGNALERLSRFIEALQSYDRATSLMPFSAMFHFNRGNALYRLGRLDEAEAAYRKASQIDGNYAGPHANCGAVLMAKRLLDEALVEIEEAIRLKPDYAEAHNNRGNILSDKGQFHQASKAYRKAIEVRREYHEAWSNYLRCLNYDPSVDEATLVTEHQNWAAQLKRTNTAGQVHENSPDPNRRLRVGFVSPDFGRHPVGFFLIPVFNERDHDRFEFYCYSGRVLEDNITALLKNGADTWRSTIGVPDEALAAQIRADRIDVLVDLTGHFGNNRLPMFALKPAPVQFHWAGYSHTTGLPEMDYALWDPYRVPEGKEARFTETVVRLPDASFCYAPHEDTPDVVLSPVARYGYVTFGSFNNTTKVNEGVVELWAKVLLSVPESRLMLNSKPFAGIKERERFESLFASHGIPAERLILTKGAADYGELLGEYGEIDIALDPFPFSGGATTQEALWMGVPVVTMPGSTPMSRQTYSLLAVLNRLEWVAKDPADYVRIATDLASDPVRLLSLRLTQRDRMAASPLCDQKRFARNFEAAMRDMWRNWCEARQPAVIRSQSTIPGDFGIFSDR